MEKDRVNFLHKCIDTIYPSGFEEEISRVWRKEADKFADRTWVDAHGNSFAVVNEAGSPRIMLAGHVDEIGLMITYIDDNGYLSFYPNRGLGPTGSPRAPGGNAQAAAGSKVRREVNGLVGLYMNPPEKAVVLCMDEKTQIQALNRTQLRLPMKKGRCGTMTHDYKRNGTTSLFAALNLLEGTVIGECHPRHRHQEFLKFLRRLDRVVPKELGLHIILDNYATHKHAEVKK
jgi:hypothetical protein